MTGKCAGAIGPGTAGRSRALSARALLVAALALLGTVSMQRSFADERGALGPPPSDRLIVKWRDSGVAAVQMTAIADRVTHLNGITGIDARPERNLFGHTDVVRLGHVPSRAEMRDILSRMRADPFVQYAEPDGYRYLADYPSSAPNDPFFTAGSDSNGSWQGQWYLLPSSATTPAAIGATSAWSTTQGSPNVVVAVIDSGIIEAHPDFIYPSGTSGPAKLQCNTGTGGSGCGYDFVSCDQGNNTSGNTADCSQTGASATYNFANDGHGWAADAPDPGDWTDSTDTGTSLFQDNGCTKTVPSSWHGTKVAGVIGAVTNNGVGIAGVAPLTTLLPVRVIGKCVARVSDIAAAILWAAGIGVSVDAGAIASSPKANIINLSLAANLPCSQTEQDAITQAIAAGVLIVAAAGNEGGALDAPANCTGVVSVVGLRHAGTKTDFSSLSSSDAAATIAAPAGNCVNPAGQLCVYPIETTSDAGTTAPAATPGFYTYAMFNQSFLNSGGNPDNAEVVGTSFAAPMVSGVAALMLAAQPALTPAQLIARLQSSATAFPTSSSTSSTSCQLASTSTDSNGHYVEPTKPAECVCTTATCGAGMLNAVAAIAAAQGMFAQIKTSSSSGLPGQRIKLDGSASTAASDYTIVGWQWTTDPATSDQIANADQSVATLVVPSFRSIDVILTITDNAGRTATARARIQSVVGAASGAGGLDGGQLAVLAGCALWGLYRRRRRPRRPSAASLN